MIRAAILACLLAIGCADMIRQQAIDTAAADHDCPRSKVRVTKNASANHGTASAFWLNVCGKKRYYRYVEEGREGGRFLDETNRFAETEDDDEDDR